MANPFQAITSQWLAKISLSMEHKKKFQEKADEAMHFLNGPYDFFKKMRAGDLEGYAKSDTPMCVNKTAELVQLFAPFLYFRNPTRKVNPRQQPMLPPEMMGDPNDPNFQNTFGQMVQSTEQGRMMDGVRASMLEHYLNYTPTALNLKDESRDAIEEALIKGLGVLWHETYRPQGANWKMVGSFYDTQDNLFVDPDPEAFRDCKWIAKRCVHPVWEVEQEYGLEPGTLKGSSESSTQQSVMTATPFADYHRKQGRTNDLIVYWKVWSKMGMGHKLAGIDQGATADLERFGTYTYLVVCNSLDYPLNLPDIETPMVDPMTGQPMIDPMTGEPAMVPLWENDQEVSQRVQWETPFWADDAWPFTPLAFHKIPRSIWPMSHLEPAMGELKFLNWAYSFVAGKIKRISKDKIAVLKGAEEEIKRAILSGEDDEIIEISSKYPDIAKVVQYLIHPPFNKDIWDVITAVEQNFEKRVGLTELMYGESAQQLRSAQEAQLKGDQIKIRPDDMANKVEEWQTEVARREALAARWHLEPQDVEPIMGPTGTYFWQQLVSSQDPNIIIHQLEYRIEAGSIAKPNRQKQSTDATNAMQQLFQPFFQFAINTGNNGPVNAVLEMWGKANDVDVSRMLLAFPPPMPVAPMPEPGQQPQPQGGM